MSEKYVMKAPHAPSATARVARLGPVSGWELVRRVASAIFALRASRNAAPKAGEPGHVRRDVPLVRPPEQHHEARHVDDPHARLGEDFTPHRQDRGGSA